MYISSCGSVLSKPTVQHRTLELRWTSCSSFPCAMPPFVCLMGLIVAPVHQVVAFLGSDHFLCVASGSLLHQGTSEMRSDGRVVREVFWLLLCGTFLISVVLVVDANFLGGRPIASQLVLPSVGVWWDCRRNASAENHVRFRAARTAFHRTLRRAQRAHWAEWQDNVTVLFRCNPGAAASAARRTFRDSAGFHPVDFFAG